MMGTAYAVFDKVERHCPVPKGLRLRKLSVLHFSLLVERHCPVPKGLRPLAANTSRGLLASKDTALFQRD